MFGVPWSLGFGVRPTFKRWFWKHSKWPWNIIHLMPCSNPCRLYIHLTFTYSVGPSSIVWSELGPAPPLHHWECFKCNGHMLLVSCVKWPFEVSSRAKVKEKGKGKINVVLIYRCEYEPVDPGDPVMQYRQEYRCYASLAKVDSKICRF